MDIPSFSTPHHIREGKIPASGVGTVSYGPDDEGAGFMVTFEEAALFMEAMSKDAGYPIYRTEIRTTLIAPGNTKTTWVHATTGLDYEMAVDPDSGEIHTTWSVREQCENGDVPEPTKYPKAWARFMRKNASSMDGFPIEEWGVVTKTYALSLKAQNIHTVEMLAGLSDVNAQNIMGGIKYRDLAKAALSERDRNRIVSREQENARRAEERADELTKKVEALQLMVDKLTVERERGGVDHDDALTQETRSRAAQVAPQLKKLSVQKGKQLKARAAARAQVAAEPREDEAAA